jgi:hypothetical protein
MLTRWLDQFATLQSHGRRLHLQDRDFPEASLEPAQPAPAQACLGAEGDCGARAPAYSFYSLLLLLLLPLAFTLRAKRFARFGP